MTPTMKDIKNVIERNILEAFALFPDTPLDLNICAKWLWEDAGLDKVTCYGKILELAGKSWLKCSMDNNRNLLISMEDNIKDQFLSDRKIYAEDHAILIWYSLDAIDKANGKPSAETELYMPLTIAIAKYFCYSDQLDPTK
ncbi:MAG: hypothetical protein ACK5MU_04290 [Candidatus Saccharimonadales bacterium]